MSLRTSPTMTPARLAADRRAALLSTGPRSRRGKARSRWNALRKGTYSETYFRVLEGLLGAKPEHMKKERSRSSLRNNSIIGRSLRSLQVWKRAPTTSGNTAKPAVAPGPNFVGGRRGAGRKFSNEPRMSFRIRGLL